MAQSKKRPQQLKQKPGQKKSTAYKPGQQVSLSLFERLDKWLDKKDRTITIIAFVCCALFTFLLFQVRMDIGGDDSNYIKRAYDFIHKGIFPDYQGALFPLVMSIFVGLFGIRIIMLKLISSVFNLLAMFFMYKTFRRRLPGFVFFPVLLLTAFNAYILTFASLTYSEACFMFIQSLMLFYFFRLYDKIESAEQFSLKDTWPDFILTALFMVLLALARSIGLFAFPALLFFLLIRKQYRGSLYLFGAFAGIEVVLSVIKKVVWHVSSQWGAERSVLLLKNQYHPSEGYVSASGLVSRFFDNSNLYLSKRFFQVIGMRSPDAITSFPFLTLLLAVFFVFVLYRAFKLKNYYILALALYTGAMLAVTFVSVQPAIDQPRFVMIYAPLLLFIFLFGFYDSLKKKSSIAQGLVVTFVGILLIVNVKEVCQKANSNSIVLKKNLDGDILYGFTPDWANYIKMSKWCADSLPAHSMVAARKMEISFIYTDKEMFFPVYKPYSDNADSVLDYLKRNKVNYVMIASLRMNPKVYNPNSVITTMRQMLYPVAKKYPNKLVFVHREGTLEPTELYKIVY